jgi:hypothetical protein
MEMKIWILAASALALGACTSPYSAEIRKTKADYAAGRMHADEYMSRIQYLYSLDEQYKESHDYEHNFSGGPYRPTPAYYQQQSVYVQPQVNVYQQPQYPSPGSPGLSIVPFPNVNQ